MVFQTHEFSANFDLENLRRFLERLKERRDIVLETDQLAEFAAQTAYDDEREIASKGRIKGKSVAFTFRVFMDDIDAPDVYVFSRNMAFIETLTSELPAFWEELGI